MIEMSREEAIRRIQEHIRIHSKKEPFTPYLDKAFYMAIKALEEQRPSGEWTPCFERLPEYGGFFLITNIDELVRVDFFRKSTNDFDNYSAIAWMPLPEPYKKEGDRNEI